jgi:RecB family endonuclease NucS
LAYLTGKSAKLGTALRLVLLVRLVIARCSVDHAGRLSARLPLATRVMMLKADDSVSIHSDRGRTSRLNNTGRDHASL